MHRLIIKVLCVVGCIGLISTRYSLVAQGNSDLTFHQVERLHLAEVSDVAWNPDGTRLAIVSYPSILMWEVKSQNLETFLANAQVSAVAWSPDGSQIASVQGGDSESLFIWSSNTGKLLKKTIHVQPYNKAYIYNLSWSPDGKRIASDSTGMNVLIWNLFGEEKIYPLVGHTGRIGETAWSPDSRQLASDGADFTVRIWDVATGKNEVTIHGSGVDWHPTEDKILGTGDNGQVYVWNSDTGKELLNFQHGSNLTIARWNFDGSMIATGGVDGLIKIWDAEHGKHLVTIYEPSGLITAMAWHPTQNMLASASCDGEVLISDFDG